MPLLEVQNNWVKQERLWGMELKFTFFDWETKRNYDILPSCLCELHQSWVRWREVCWVCAGTSLALVQPKAGRSLSCYSQQCTDWVGITRAKGRSVLDTLKLERQKSPRCCSASREGNQLSIRTSPQMSSWLAGGESQVCPCPFPALFSSTVLAVGRQKFSLAGSATPRSLLATEGLAVSPSPNYWGALRAAGLGVRCSSLQRKR